MSQKVLRLPRNDVGRDFVIGDIHFKTIDLYKGLLKLGFDKTIDRVIGVGDLIDRGPGVLDGLKLLDEPWFFTVQGNHEQMLINAHRENPSARYVAHGAGWWSTICTGHTWIPAPVRLGNVLALDCTGGGEGPLAIYCVQDDTIYVEGRPVSLDQADVVTELLEELEQTVGNLKATIHANRLIESQSLSQEADELTRRLNTTWLTLRSEIGESQKLLNALHGLSLLTEERRAAKLEELKFKHSGTQIEGLLSRLLD